MRGKRRIASSRNWARRADGIPPIAPDAYASLFAELAEERPVRPAYGRHPRLAILGPLEARLLSFDTIVLGGLNEGTWPSSATADPWLSRPDAQNAGASKRPSAPSASPRMISRRSRLGPA